MMTIEKNIAKSHWLLMLKYVSVVWRAKKGPYLIILKALSLSGHVSRGIKQKQDSKYEGNGLCFCDSYLMK